MVQETVAKSPNSLQKKKKNITNFLSCWGNTLNTLSNTVYDKFLIIWVFLGICKCSTLSKAFFSCRNVSLCHRMLSTTIGLPCKNNNVLGLCKQNGVCVYLHIKREMRSDHRSLRTRCNARSKMSCPLVFRSPLLNGNARYKQPHCSHHSPIQHDCMQLCKQAQVSWVYTTCLRQNERLSTLLDLSFWVGYKHVSKGIQVSVFGYW